MILNSFYQVTSKRSTQTRDRTPNAKKAKISEVEEENIIEIDDDAAQFDMTKIVDNNNGMFSKYPVLQSLVNFVLI